MTKNYHFNFSFWQRLYIQSMKSYYFHLFFSWNKTHFVQPRAGRQRPQYSIAISRWIVREKLHSNFDFVSVALLFFQIEIWNVDAIHAKHKQIASTTSLSLSSLAEDIMELTQHSGVVTRVCFSLDGAAVATASLDGTIMFFQVSLFFYMSTIVKLVQTLISQTCLNRE